MLVAIGTSAPFPAVDASAHEIGHQIDARAVMATWIGCTVVYVVIAGESVVTFGTNAVKRIDAVDAGTAIPARAISAVVNVVGAKMTRIARIALARESRTIF